jgi:hypothetical protein
VRAFVIYGAAFAIMFFATNFMLAFRQIGLKKYLEGDMVLGSTYMGGPVDERESLFVDANLYNIIGVQRSFPERIDFMRWEILSEMIFRPIPRAIFPWKPLGISLKIEDALARDGKPMTLTISITIIGELFVGFGAMGVGVGCLIFGACGGWWSRLGSRRNSDMGMLVYVSGFFAFAISMRSIFMIGVALLPTLAAIVFTWWAVRKIRDVIDRRRAEKAAALPSGGEVRRLPNGRLLPNRSR